MGGGPERGCGLSWDTGWRSERKWRKGRVAEPEAGIAQRARSCLRGPQHRSRFLGELSPHAASAEECFFRLTLSLALAPSSHGARGEHDSTRSSCCRELCAGRADRSAPSGWQWYFLCSPLINRSSVFVAASRARLKGACACLCAEKPRAVMHPPRSPPGDLSLWPAPLPVQQPASPPGPSRNHHRDYNPIQSRGDLGPASRNVFFRFTPLVKVHLAWKPGARHSCADRVANLM